MTKNYIHSAPKRVGKQGGSIPPVSTHNDKLIFIKEQGILMPFSFTLEKVILSSSARLCHSCSRMNAHYILRSTGKFPVGYPICSFCIKDLPLKYYRIIQDLINNLYYPEIDEEHG